MSVKYKYIEKYGILEELQNIILRANILYYMHLIAYYGIVRGSRNIKTLK